MTESSRREAMLKKESMEMEKLKKSGISLYLNERKAETGEILSLLEKYFGEFMRDYIAEPDGRICEVHFVHLCGKKEKKGHTRKKAVNS